MLFGRKKMRNDIQSVGKAVVSELSTDIRLTLDAQHVASSWREKPRPAEGNDNAPFALLSYYEPTCGFVNPGDAIQTIAVKHALEKAGVSTIQSGRLIRDELSLYDGPAVRCVMQGWFSHGHLFWPSPSIRPIFIGTHLTAPAQAFVSRLVEYAPDIRRSAEIGCRDLFTLDFCRSIGIKSYFSRCLTLSLPRRNLEEKGSRVFLVDIPEEYMRFIPKDVSRDAKSICQRHYSSDIGGARFSPSEQESLAESFLATYRTEASLVVTTAIHVAMPCIAMGIPVVFVEGPVARDPNRYTSLSGIIPVHTRGELRGGRIDFHPQCPDIERLKEALVENLRLSIAKEAGKPVDDLALEDVRQQIVEWR